MNKLEKLQAELKDTIQLRDMAEHSGTKSLLNRKITQIIKQIDRVSF